jgi:NAD(P)-dependent dehydrogenase (short-subunit alcohol dehydrogenase family)
VCKAEFSRLHFFYDQLCPPCAELSYEKRTQTADLSGRTALVTGGRVKIGYQAAILLLRAGARVLVTTRFPHDAARRFAGEQDFGVWRDRLEIHGLDLRLTPAVERFARGVNEREAGLDFILHNACQTVRRPPAFYAHLVEHEQAPPEALPATERRIVRAYHEDRRARRGAIAHDDPALLSQAVLTPEDRALAGKVELFPAGELDQDLQQIDLRPANSWRMTLAEVPIVELLEVHLVNAIAPFVLSARLKPALLRSPGEGKHIVNVSAMEGQFYRDHKTDKHPHTNMAKAALNMLTRTSAADYARDGIYMNSVDTGWVTDEDPATLAARKREEHGFHPPLDVVDGAARICDPIFSGVLTGRHVYGQFFKDYRPVDW